MKFLSEPDAKYMTVKTSDLQVKDRWYKQTFFQNHENNN
jgi:hypothetical protein